MWNVMNAQRGDIRVLGSVPDQICTNELW